MSYSSAAKIKKLTNIRTIPTKYHIIFWVGYFIFNVVRWGSYYQDYWYSFKSNLVTFSMAMILAYVNIYYLVPKFILTKKFKRYVLYFLIALTIFYVIRTELIYYFINENVWPESETPQTAYSFDHVVVVYLIGIHEVALVTSLKLMVDWIYERKRVERLQEIQLKTELNFLKAQIQPHFYFNTLNNLYALTLEKSEEAPDVVLKLSDIMQYVIYDVKSNNVSLEKEINYINNYISLEKMRHGQKIDISLDIEGDISNVEVPPLLFLSYVENIFKHGVKGNPKFYAKINFVLQKNSNLKFLVENSFVKSNEPSKKQGIGNANSERRLDLLYKDKYSLKISNDESVYKVELEIPLTK